jgi:hypothetical protein
MFATYADFPSGVTAIANGPVPTLMDLATWNVTRLMGVMVLPAVTPQPVLATYAHSPLGLTATAYGEFPTGIGGLTSFPEGVTKLTELEPVLTTQITVL